MQIDPDTLSARDLYQHLIRLITPRPIAWVSTLSPTGITNLAPFSFFTGITSKPPTLLFSCVDRADGTLKDTPRNILATGEFVVNVVSFPDATAMNASSADWPEEVSEFEACGIVPQPSTLVRPPQVASAPAAFECRLWQSVRVEEAPGTLGATLIIGRIVSIRIEDSILDPQGWPDPERLDTIGRFGGESYTRTTDSFDLRRPPKPQT